MLHISKSSPATTAEHETLFGSIRLRTKLGPAARRDEAHLSPGALLCRAKESARTARQGGFPPPLRDPGSAGRAGCAGLGAASAAITAPEAPPRPRPPARSRPARLGAAAPERPTGLAAPAHVTAAASRGAGPGREQLRAPLPAAFGSSSPGLAAECSTCPPWRRWVQPVAGRSLQPSRC